MIWIYALSSQIRNYIYVGITSNLDRIIREHKSGKEQTTRAYRPFKLLYSEQCENRLEGRKREKYWKSGVGKEQLRRLREKI